MQEAKAIVKASDYDLDEASATDITTSFQPMITERDVLAKEYEDIISLDIDEHTSRKAGTLRRRLVKIRTGIAKIHKTQKEMFLKAGQFVDAIKNAQTAPVSQMEEKLSEIEKHQENIELERIRKVKEARTAELRKYEVLDEQFPAHIGQMEDEVWTNYLAGVKGAYDLRKEAETKAEEERLAKEKAAKQEQERIAAENESLKADAAEREKAEKARAAKEAKANAKLEDERKAAEAQLELERKKLEKMEAEKKEAEDAAAKEVAEAEAREKDTKHRKAVDKTIADAMMLIDVSLEYAICDKIVKAIANGEFPNLSISY